MRYWPEDGDSGPARALDAGRVYRGSRPGAGHCNPRELDLRQTESLFFIIGIMKLLLVAGLALAACVPVAVAQITVPIAELVRDANVVAVATVERITEAQGPTVADRTLTVQLRLGRVLIGQPSSMTVIATLAEKCYSGGGGVGHTCVMTSGMEGMTGLWLLKAGDSGYQIVPIERLTDKPEGLFLPVQTPASDQAAGADLDSILLTYAVKWIQSFDGRPTGKDIAIYGAFEPSAQARPNQEHVLAAIAPLLASSSPAQHAMGLVIALRAESADAMTQVVNEISTLRSNPRFDEIMFAIGAYPTGGVPGSKSPQWIAPIARLIAMPEIPGMDASLAGALYRIGTPETWPLIAAMLDSKDPTAQMIAARTIAMRVPHAMATAETQRFLPGMPGSPGSTAEYVEFWKAWWTQNRAALGFTAGQ
jgi:hypothetical protein